MTTALAPEYEMLKIGVPAKVRPLRLAARFTSVPPAPLHVILLPVPKVIVLAKPPPVAVKVVQVSWYVARSIDIGLLVMLTAPKVHGPPNVTIELEPVFHASAVDIFFTVYAPQDVVEMLMDDPPLMVLLVPSNVPV
jgi:hypothetical protein